MSTHLKLFFSKFRDYFTIRIMMPLLTLYASDSCAVPVHYTTQVTSCPYLVKIFISIESLHRGIDPALIKTGVDWYSRWYLSCVDSWVALHCGWSDWVGLKCNAGNVIVSLLAISGHCVHIVGDWLSAGHVVWLEACDWWDCTADATRFVADSETERWNVLRES